MILEFLPLESRSKCSKRETQRQRQRKRREIKLVSVYSEVGGGSVAVNRCRSPRQQSEMSNKCRKLSFGFLQSKGKSGARYKVMDWIVIRE